ncbi:hypothetical protein NBRC116592_00160 [Colwellia sp. KU-HH00111]
MYGHLFIKLNRDHNSTTKHKTSELLNASLNYGAIVPNKENPVMYVLKGIFGNYDAGYSDQQFYRHQHNYGNVELRDLWDYKLSLTQEDVDLIVAHIWELLGNKFDYYFIDENCAFHIAKLLEIVLPNPLISNNSLWVLPSDVAKGIVQASYNASMLLEKVDYIPSSESILRDYYQQLTVTQQNIAQALVALNFDFTNKNYQQLAVQDKKIIVESLFQYINVMKQKQPDNKQLEKNKKKLIKERYQMPIGKIISVQPTQSKFPPHQGMETSKYSLGYASVKQNQFLTAGFRMTYFDNLSMNLAKQPFANLEMIDIELIATDDEIRISKVDLIDIDSLYIPAIPWANGSESAWSVRAGYEQVNNQCFDCGIYFAEGDIGKSTLYQDNHLLYAMLGGKIFFGSEDDINLSAKMGIISQFSDRFKLKLAVQKITDSNFSKASQTIWSGEINYQIAPDWELRFLVNKQYSTKIELKVNYFWGF